MLPGLAHALLLLDDLDHERIFLWKESEKRKFFCYNNWKKQAVSFVGRGGDGGGGRREKIYRNVGCVFGCVKRKEHWRYFSCKTAFFFFFVPFQCSVLLSNQQWYVLSSLFCLFIHLWAVKKHLKGVVVKVTFLLVFILFVRGGCRHERVEKIENVASSSELVIFESLFFSMKETRKEWKV